MTKPKIKRGAVVKGKIRKNAVRSGKIKNGSVKAKDLARSAKGAKVHRYAADGHDFATDDEVTVELPGALSTSAFRASVWEVQLVFHQSGDGTRYVHPLAGSDGDGGNRFTVRRESDGSVFVRINANFVAMESIQIFRTTPTSATRNTTNTRSVTPREGAGDGAKR